MTDLELWCSQLMRRVWFAFILCLIATLCSLLIWEILGGLGNPFWAASEEAIECLIEFKELDLTIMLDWLHSFIEVKA